MKSGSGVVRRCADEERIREGKEVGAMTGIGWEMFSTKVSLLLVTLVSTVLFVYVWLRSHGVEHMTHPHVDKMAGDEGDD
ncbi:MAG TPA: hypothetical protein VI298_04640 [Geobacteraceae bacterium]